MACPLFLCEQYSFLRCRHVVCSGITGDTNQPSRSSLWRAILPTLFSPYQQRGDSCVLLSLYYRGPLIFGSLGPSGLGGSGCIKARSFRHFSRAVTLTVYSSNDPSSAQITSV